MQNKINQGKEKIFHNQKYGILLQFHTHPIRITLTVASLVRIIFFGVNATIVDYKLKAIIHETAIAALVVRCVTINQFLLRQRD